MAKQCEFCGKNDWDESKGCKSYTTFTSGVGDWLCTFRWNLKEKARNNAAKKAR